MFHSVILYGDGTVSDTIVSGKKPIGVVFDEENRLAVALTNVTKDGSVIDSMTWSSSYCDTPNLENCGGGIAATTSCGLDGRENTDAILASTCNGTTYAANEVNAYQTSNCSASFCQKGKWFLPSLRDLNTIYKSLNLINNTLNLLQSMGAEDIEGTYWSSAEYSAKSQWVLNLSRGNTYYYGKTTEYCHVRPVLAF